LNQGFGSVIFYNWVREVRRRGVKITLNMHDEIQLRVKKENIDEVKIILQESMDFVNKKFNLAVPIKIDIAVGKNYGDTH
jgi:DNA polymerase I-like protein with 3'-5' exonuclease and polymerase domains